MRFFAAVVAVLAVATVVGLVVPWPGHVETPLAEGFAVDTQRAEVQRVEERLCPNFSEQKRQLATVRLESGPNAGDEVRLQLNPDSGLDPDLDPSDEIRVTKGPEVRPGTEGVAGTGYTFNDFERRGPMLVAGGRSSWRSCCCSPACGAPYRSTGLGFGSRSCCCSSYRRSWTTSRRSRSRSWARWRWRFVTIPLAHGGGPKSLSALLGTAVSLLLTAGPGGCCSRSSRSSLGLSSEEATFLQLGQARPVARGPAACGHGHRGVGGARRRESAGLRPCSRSANANPSLRVPPSSSGARSKSGATT